MAGQLEDKWIPPAFRSGVVTAEELKLKPVGVSEPGTVELTPYDPTTDPLDIYNTSIPKVTKEDIGGIPSNDPAALRPAGVIESELDDILTELDAKWTAEKAAAGTNRLTKEEEAAARDVDRYLQAKAEGKKPKVPKKIKDIVDAIYGPIKGEKGGFEVGRAGAFRKAAKEELPADWKPGEPLTVGTKVEPEVTAASLAAKVAKAIKDSAESAADRIAKKVKATKARIQESALPSGKGWQATRLGRMVETDIDPDSGAEITRVLYAGKIKANDDGTWAALGPHVEGEPVKDIEQLGNYANPAEAKAAVEEHLAKLRGKMEQLAAKTPEAKRRVAQRISTVADTEKWSMRYGDTEYTKETAPPLNHTTIYQVERTNPKGLPGVEPDVKVGTRVQGKIWNIEVNGEALYTVSLRGPKKGVLVRDQAGNAIESLSGGSADDAIAKIKALEASKITASGRGTREPRFDSVWFIDRGRAEKLAEEIGPSARIVRAIIPNADAEERRLVNLATDHPVRIGKTGEELTHLIYVPEQGKGLPFIREPRSTEASNVLGLRSAKEPVELDLKKIISHRWTLEDDAGFRYLDQTAEGYKGAIKKITVKEKKGAWPTPGNENWLMIDANNRPFGIASNIQDAARTVQKLADAPVEETESLLAQAKGILTEWLRQTEFREKYIKGYLGSEKGAIYLDPLKKAAKAEVPNVQRRPMSMEEVYGIDGAAEEVLGTGAAGEAASTLSRLGILAKYRLPVSWMSQNEFSHKFYNLTLGARNKLMLKLAPSLQRKLNRIIEEFPAIKENGDEAIYVAEHLELGLDGNYKLPEGYSATEGLGKAILRYRTWIMDRLWRITKGYDPKAALWIQRLLGRQETGQDLELLKAIQLGEKRAPSKLWQTLAEKTEGMLNFDASYDYKTFAPYENGYFPHMQIASERALLKQAIAESEKMLELGGSPATETKYRQAIAEAQARLDKLERQKVARATAKETFGAYLPNKQYYGPLSEAREFPDENFSKDFESVTTKYIWGALNKRYMDQMFYNARAMLEQARAYGQLDVDLQSHIFEWINLQRGVKGFNEDTWIRQVAASFTNPKMPAWARTLGEKYLDENNIRRSVSEWMKFTAFTKLFMGLRFPLVNFTQSGLTVYPLVGGKIYGRAFATAVKDYMSLASGQVGIKEAGRVGLGNAWMRARAAGALGEAGERFMMEAESLGATRSDKLLKNWPITKLAEWTEAFNRVVAYEAGRIKAYQPGFNPQQAQKVVKTFLLTEGMSQKLIADRYARAVVDATQFILTKEGKPLAFGGGALRRIWGQFQSYRIGYGSLLFNLARHDGAGFARAMGALVAVAGPAGLPFFEAINHAFLKNGLPPLPDVNGAAWALRTAGLDIPPIDVTAGVEPFNLPRSFGATDVMSMVLGPTFGGALGVVDAASKEGWTSPRAIRAGIRAAVPEVGNIAETAKAYSRGGLVTLPGGEPVMKLNNQQMLARILGLRPALKADYYRARDQLKSAIEGQNWSAVQAIMERERGRGVLMTRRNMSGIIGQIKAERTKTAIGSVGDIYK